MTVLNKVYRKNDEEIVVSDKFIYCDTIYIKYSNGVALLSEKYYASNKPIKYKLKKSKNKKKNHLLRFFELQYAPEEYLITNNYERLI